MFITITKLHLNRVFLFFITDIVIVIQALLVVSILGYGDIYTSVWHVKDIIWGYTAGLATERQKAERR